jgi:hypothetical protein|tara:strand:- start:140 stop:259 length:120 start_codon:yes stop_codon:yes gene_type:complete
MEEALSFVDRLIGEAPQVMPKPQLRKFETDTFRFSKALK